MKLFIQKYKCLTKHIYFIFDRNEKLRNERVQKEKQSESINEAVTCPINGNKTDKQKAKNCTKSFEKNINREKANRKKRRNE